MNSKQIETIMTEKVSEYIQKGYILNAATMAGSQGEISKIDLRKGDEVIRVMLTQESGFGGDYEQVTILTVGRAIVKARSDRDPFDTMCRTLWNSDLEVVEERRFYSNRGANCFTEDIAEAKAMKDKMIARYRVRSAMREGKVSQTVTSDAAKAIVLPFIKKQPKCSRVKACDIQKIVKYFKCEYSSMHYVVTLYNGKTFKIA